MNVGEASINMFKLECHDADVAHMLSDPHLLCTHVLFRPGSVCKMNKRCEMTPYFTVFFFSNSFPFRANTYWFFVPICAPFLGAVVGVLVYQLMIGYHLEREVEGRQKTEEEERFELSNNTTNGDS